MARKSRRQVANDDSDGDDENGQEPMSPNTRKTYYARITMEQDLGNANAEFLTTTDYHRHEQSRVTIVRRSDITGTAESKKAADSKEQLKQWRMYGRTEEAVSTTIGAKEPVGSGNGNAHRARLQAELQATSLSLTDTYERDYSQPRPSNNGRPHITKYTLKQQSPHSTVTAPAHKPTERQRNDRGKPIQARPWPPPGLKGTPAFTSPNGPQQTHQASNSGTSISAVALSKSKLVEPHDFMSFFKNTLNVSNTTKPPTTQDNSALAEPEISSPAQVTFSTPAVAKPWSPTQVEPPTAPHATSNSTPSAAALKPQGIATDAVSTSPSCNEIRKVPVEEFSFPLNNALAPGDVATHTDGAPSPATLSGFSDSPSLSANGIGTRAAPTAAKSPIPPNIMDSPILDDVSSIGVMRGQDWVPKSQFTALQAEVAALKKELVEFAALKEELAEMKLKQSLATVATSPAVPFSLPDGKADLLVPELEPKHSRAIRADSASLAMSKFAPPPSLSRPLGLGISTVEARASVKQAIKSPDLDHGVLKPISTNGGSIFGDSRVIQGRSRHVQPTESTDLLTQPFVKKAPKHLTRGPAGPGFPLLLEHLGQLPVGGPPRVSQSGLQFVANGPVQQDVEVESDGEL